LLAGCGDSGAEKQKEASEITKGIEDYLALLEVPSQQIRLRHDKVTVTPAEDGKSFQVAITGIRYGSETVAQATFGELDYKLTTDDEDFYQASALKMPKEIAILDLDGKPYATVKLATTAFSMTWSKSLQNPVKYDWQAKDFSVVNSAKPDD